MTDEPETPRRIAPNRRELFTALGSAAVAGVAGWAVHGAVTASADPTSAPTESPAAPDDRGVVGITSPPVPQRHALLTTISMPGVDPDALAAAVGQMLRTPVIAPEDAGKVSVTVGFAPTHARVLWPERARLAEELPTFARDVAGMLTEGDLILQVCAENNSTTKDVTNLLLAALPGADVVWRQSGYRDSPTPQGTSRTNTGFIDGIINPRSATEQSAGVWIDDSHDTYLVVRRMTIADDFLRSPVGDQERAIGRRRDTGAPLSGGGALDEVDLLAKSADGSPLTPRGAHARRAHPANIGRPLMSRRSYSFDLERGAGLIFIAFMNDPQTFIVTQRRLDEQDDLLRHTSTDASGCFFVPDMQNL